MNVKEWFAKGCDYLKGLSLFRQLNPSLQRQAERLLKEGETHSNKYELRYELEKHLNKDEPDPATPTPLKRKNLKESVKREFGGIRFSDLPSELRPRFKAMVAVFYQVCELKLQLNDLPDQSEKEALLLQTQIFDLFEFRDLVWRELDYWKQQKRLLPQPTVLKHLTPAQMVAKRNNLYSNISKKKKKISQLEQELSESEYELDQAVNTQKLQQTIASLHNFERQLYELNKQINGTATD